MAIKVFVSGNLDEFRDARGQAITAIDDLEGLEPVAWELLSTDSNPPREVGLGQLGKRDIYVGIFGRDYSDASVEEYRDNLRLLHLRTQPF